MKALHFVVNPLLSMIEQQSSITFAADWLLLCSFGHEIFIARWLIAFWFDKYCHGPNESTFGL
jgi:hypothetical protein